MLQGSYLNDLFAYWQKQLKDVPAQLILPTDRPHPAFQTFRGASLSMPLPGGLATELRALSQQQGATLFMTLLAAFGALLSRYSGQTDLVIGTPIANRTRSELEALIGFFVNTLALRLDLSGAPSFTTLLERVRRWQPRRTRIGPALRNAGRQARPRTPSEPYSAVPGDVRAGKSSRRNSPRRSSP